MEKSAIVGAFIRHLLTTAGGYLVSQGLIESAQVEPLVGSLLILAGVAWSVWQKRQAMK